MGRNSEKKESDDIFPYRRRIYTLFCKVKYSGANCSAPLHLPILTPSTKLAANLQKKDPERLMFPVLSRVRKSRENNETLNHSENNRQTRYIFSLRSVVFKYTSSVFSKDLFYFKKIERIRLFFAPYVSTTILIPS